MSSGSTLQPTFNGHVATTQDALILFEACLQGHLSHVPRRPHDRERNSLIRSGCVFIYEENASGIKRWTDGVTWSPSRILGNFLVYRELDKPFPPGEKKKANKNKRRTSRPGDPYARPDASENGSYSPTPPSANSFGTDKAASEMERQLIGSLIDSYGFKSDGLVKKTMSVTVQGVTHHLVSYYNIQDVLGNQLRTPSQTDNLTYIRPRNELTSNQNFRSPLEEVDEYENQARQAQAQGYGYRMPAPGYGMPEYKGQPYYMPHPYPPVGHQQPPPASYTTAPLPPTYIQAPVSTPQLQPQRSGGYGPYESSTYNRSYDSLNANGAPNPGQKSEAPTQPMSTSMGHRPQQEPPMYPQAQAPSRQMTNGHLSPVSMESRQSQQYYTTPADPNSADGRQSQASPHQMSFENNRGPHQTASHMYNDHRGPYYADGPGPAMHQSPYHQAPPLSAWAGAPPASHPQ